MIQVCEPPRQRQVRRLSAEEFCTRLGGETSSVYRPRAQVLRMLAVGEAWGCGRAALLLQPLNGDTALAQALRCCLGWRGVEAGCFLTPAVGPPEAVLPLLAAAAPRARTLARGGRVLAVLECTARAGALLPLYIRQGLALRALRPLDSLAPCFVLEAGCRPQAAEPVWVPLEDRVHLAMLLARGYGALEARPCQKGQELVLGMYPVTAWKQNREDVEHESCDPGKLCDAGGGPGLVRCEGPGAGHRKLCANCL